MQQTLRSMGAPKRILLGHFNMLPAVTKRLQYSVISRLLNGTTALCTMQSAVASSLCKSLEMHKDVHWNFHTHCNCHCWNHKAKKEMWHHLSCAFNSCHERVCSGCKYANGYKLVKKRGFLKKGFF